MATEAVHPDAASSALSVDERTHRAVGIADAVARRAGYAAWDLFGFLQFLFFLVYLLLSAIGFWLGALAALLGTVRMAVRFTKGALLYMSGGHPPPPGGRAERLPEAARQEIRRLWDSRLLLYADAARPVARQYVAARFAWRRFWYWGVMRKLSTVLVAAFMVALPLVYIIPRPHEVQITDDNAMSHTDGEIRYLIHALDLHDPSDHLEYENEYALHLGKINPQGLKSQLQNGRYYRLWVVGLRWYYFPKTAFPNILWATEIDKDGNEITGGGLLAKPVTAAAPEE